MDSAEDLRHVPDQRLSSKEGSTRIPAGGLLTGTSLMGPMPAAAIGPVIGRGGPEPARRALRFRLRSMQFRLYDSDSGRATHASQTPSCARSARVGSLPSRWRRSGWCENRYAKGRARTRAVVGLRQDGGRNRWHDAVPAARRHDQWQRRQNRTLRLTQQRQYEAWDKAELHSLDQLTRRRASAGWAHPRRRRRRLPAPRPERCRKRAPGPQPARHKTTTIGDEIRDSAPQPTTSIHTH